MYLVEDFYSFQGEGKYIGTPSIFLRFGGCNLKCVGFNSKLISLFDSSLVIGCDSLSAVDKKHFGVSWKKIENADELLNIVESYQKELNFIPDIVITGGEPLIYHKNQIFYNLITKLDKYRVTVETNASIEIDFMKYPKYKNLIFAMSVKLANSKEEFQKRINHNAIKNIVENSYDSFFKFVLDKKYIDKYQNSEIKNITFKYPNIQIYSMPMGESLSAISKNDKEVIEFCKKYGYIYSDRLHIRIYNKRRGV